MYLYSDPTITSGSDANGNSQLSGSNAIYLEKVTSAWSEYTVTWNTQPATTTTDRVWVGPSVSTTENVEIDLSTLVQGWVDDPQSNYGVYTNTAREIRRPLIVVEGFDAWRILHPDNPAENFSFDRFINGRGPGELSVPINYSYGTTTYTTLSDALEGEDYDLIFIDFDNGTDYIQRNAYLVENVIQWVNSRKQPYAGVMQQNVVVGFSMGGLVARYALRDMEQNAIPTDTRLYVSFDSPHQGANVPLGFHAMVSHLNGVGLDFAFARDIQDIANNLPIPFSITRFGFVPTFSALDIGGGMQTIVDPDLSRAYSPASPPPAAPKNVVAANFFTNPTAAGTSNELHTQITLRNGRWLFQEIEQIPAYFSCAYVCGATDISPYISGPDAICSGNAVYTLNNPDGAVAFTWTPSTNLNYVSGQGTQTYTVSKGTNGDGFVQVVLDGDCGNSVPFVKNIDIGGETASFSITPYPTCGTTGDVIYFYAEISNVNYSWTVHGGTILDGQGTRAIDAQMTSSYMFVDCYVTGTSPDNCYSPEGGSSVSIHQCSGFSALSASPNPASSSLNVELSEPLEYTEPVQVELRNHFGVLVKNQTVQGNRFDINTCDIRNGMYILIVKYKDRVFNETVIIER